MNDLDVDEVPPAPEYLGARGRAFWDKAMEHAEFDAHEEEVLIEACRTMDAIDALAEAVERDGVMLTGSQGQPVLNGALAEQRQQQASLARLILQLNLDSVDVAQMKSAKQRAQSAAAKRNYRNQKKAESRA